MKRVRRVAAVVGASTLMLSVAAFPALAIGDGKVPAGAPGTGEGCAMSDSAVGTPLGNANPGLDNTGTNSETGQRVGAGGPVSATNPGASEGAEGDTASAGNSDNCQNLSPGPE